MTWVQGLTGVDFVLIGVMAAALLLGWLRGFVQVLTGFVVLIVSTVVAGQFAATTLAWLNRTWGVQDKLNAAFERQIHLPPEAYQLPMGSISLPKARELLQSVPIPESYRLTLAQRLADWTAPAVNETAASYVLHQLAAGVLNAVVFLALFALLAAVLGVIGRLIADRVRELPVVGVANALLGAAAIGFEAALVIALLVGLVGPMLPMYGLGPVGQAVESAKLTPAFLTLYRWLWDAVFGTAAGAFPASWAP